MARTRTVHWPIGPVAYDCVKIIVVCAGSAVLFSEFGQKPVKVGDVVVLGANTLCGCEPEGHITVTTIYADTDYVIDQVFWQHVGSLQDLLDALEFAATVYTELAQILRLGEKRAGQLRVKSTRRPRHTFFYLSPAKRWRKSSEHNATTQGPIRERMRP